MFDGVMILVQELKQNFCMQGDLVDLTTHKGGGST